MWKQFFVDMLIKTGRGSIWPVAVVCQMFFYSTSSTNPHGVVRTNWHTGQTLAFSLMVNDGNKRQRSWCGSTTIKPAEEGAGVLLSSSDLQVAGSVISSPSEGSRPGQSFLVRAHFQTTEFPFLWFGFSFLTILTHPWLETDMVQFCLVKWGWTQASHQWAGGLPNPSCRLRCTNKAQAFCRWPIP